MTETIKKIINYVVHAMEPQTIILFGSMATGKNTVHSDIDLLIITEDTHFRSRLQNQIQSFTKELGIASDILIHSCNELKEASFENNAFLSLIVEQGKIIYKKDI